MVRLSTALAQFVLVISFIWSICVLNAYRNKRYTLSFYNFIVGASSAGLGVLRYGNPLFEGRLLKLDDRMLRLTQSMYPALVAVELLLMNWPDHNPTEHFLQLFMFCCIFGATFWFYERQSSKRKWRLRMISKDMHVKTPLLFVSMALAVGLLSNNFQGIVASTFLIVNTLFVGTSGLIFEMPARDLYSYIQVVCNYHIVSALTHS